MPGMKLSEILNGISEPVAGGAAIDVTGVTADSRNVAPGDIFVAISGGTARGSDFAAEAVRAGARAGLGISTSPDFIAQPYIDAGELVALYEGYLPTDRGIYAIYPHRRYLPAKVRTFVDFLSNWFRRREEKSK